MIAGPVIMDAVAGDAVTGAALTAAARTCEAIVSTLPRTGAGDPLWWLAGAVLAIGAGVGALLWSRYARRSSPAGERPRGRRAAPATLLVGLVVLALLGVPDVGRAQAAAGAAAAVTTVGVDYGSGCSLIAVDAGGAAQSAPVTDLLPGDSVVAMTVPVTGTYTEAIELSGTMRSPGSTGGTDVEVRFDGMEGPVHLVPGERTLATVTVRLRASAGNRLQGARLPVDLVLTATAR
jgi:hypothetical protein